MTQPTAAGPSNTPIPALNNDNNNSTYNTASGGPSQPLALQPGTFQSLIPMVDDIFSTLYQQSISGEKVSTALAAEQVAPKLVSRSLSALEGED
ncbi:hypothetical protein I317_02934 [Kwoniella heveanensis CBS 569]|nr:hypothetical protein I317_02934 [Kwoniella heveanensis CBS 569]